ncbi:hypothetical protein SESBI_44876 [Sesbania bispinosa]|nr:hypothetical protein SESBI_44876 [Sesbania bispinosa]
MPGRQKGGKGLGEVQRGHEGIALQHKGDHKACDSEIGEDRWREKDQQFDL